MVGVTPSELSMAAAGGGKMRAKRRQGSVKPYARDKVGLNEAHKKHVLLGGSRFQVKSSPRGFVESGRGFGIWLAQWHLHSPMELDFFILVPRSRSQGHKLRKCQKNQ